MMFLVVIFNGVKNRNAVFFHNGMKLIPQLLNLSRVSPSLHCLHVFLLLSVLVFLCYCLLSLLH